VAAVAPRFGGELPALARIIISHKHLSGNLSVPPLGQSPTHTHPRYPAAALAARVARPRQHPRTLHERTNASSHSHTCPSTHIATRVKACFPGPPPYNPHPQSPPGISLLTTFSSGRGRGAGGGGGRAVAAPPPRRGAGGLGLAWQGGRRR
jgi:hypothetical protein